MLHQDEDRQVGSPGGPPERTTPTWEIELLLSGALVFGLAQWPREVDALFYPAFNRLSGGGELLALLASLPSPPRRPWGLSVAAVLVTGHGLLYLVDRWLDPRIPAGSLAGRVLQGAFRRLRWLGLGNPGGALITTFQGAEGTGRTTLLTTAVLLPGHYGNQRGDGRTANPLPFIPERVVRGPYLELFVPFVPFVPRRDADAVDARCPGPGGGQAGTSGAAAGDVRDRLDCVGALFPVRLDGQPLAVRFDAAADPVTGNRGLLAMIPVTGLASGRHELEVDRPRPPKDDSRARERPPWRIPFWR